MYENRTGCEKRGKGGKDNKTHVFMVDRTIKMCELLSFEKDIFLMKLLGYGTIQFPSGEKERIFMTGKAIKKYNGVNGDAMNVLLISAMAKENNGGIVTWTKGFIEKCISTGIGYQLVNMDMVGDRKKNLTARRNFKDELIRTERIFRCLKHSLSRENYTVAHINTACGGFGLIRDYIIAKIINGHDIPIVVQYHCSINDCVKNKISLFFLRKIAAIGKRNFVLNNSSKEYLEKKTYRDAYLLPNFIDESIISTKKEISKKLSVIFYDGRVELKKGAFEIFNTAKEFPDIKFVLAGSISDEVSKWDKPENIKMVGTIEPARILKLLDKADIFLFPSHTEGFSLSLLESMARGVPSIATDVGANKEMLEGVGGMIVDVGNVEKIVNSIRELENYDRRKEMSNWLLDKVKSTYAASIVFKQLISTYEEISNG